MTVGQVVAVVFGCEVEGQTTDGDNQRQVMLPVAYIRGDGRLLHLHLTMTERETVTQVHILPEREVDASTGIEHLIFICCRLVVLQYCRMSVYVESTEIEDTIPQVDAFAGYETGLP